MRALITGGTGFVGSHLVRALLERGDAVDAIVRPTAAPERVALLEGATIHPHTGGVEALTDIVGAARPDVVFHLAAKFVAEHSPADVAPLIDANVRFGTELLDAMRTHEVDAVVNTGTVWQHHESAGYDPVCLYAATKEAFEMIIEHFRRAEGLRCLTLELTDTYGPDDPRGKLIALLLRLAREGGSVDFSPGEQRLDLVHIDDVIAAYLVAADRVLTLAPGGLERFVVRGGEPISIRDLARKVEHLTGATLDLRWGARAYRRREVMEPSPHGATLPDWCARVTLDEGLRSLIAEGSA